ncbi:hypothetical protein K437DRAFT_265540 [Tilletiaria anomala UBC 951]|uniref:Uncharacterized protein n=1 Tax=Tilletiaria anomala (strain ATCC 24038 / CBS 436.72 / UBC 951) TaxID=1037660 RepID=A0A066UZK9_TILAU|nr:uncharacterized protein K437DRAFT_265540 [Tilletiaria anomala UBC 951]KDN34887.1 hypothetical protein K437DRAFT_265540 [Tilletiaria anomala UBC 951]
MALLLKVQSWVQLQRVVLRFLKHGKVELENPEAAVHHKLESAEVARKPSAKLKAERLRTKNNTTATTIAVAVAWHAKEENEMNEPEASNKTAEEEKANDAVLGDATLSAGAKTCIRSPKT